MLHVEQPAATLAAIAKFIDAPRGEEDRLAAWGLAPASSSASAEPATPGAGGDDGDGDDEGGNSSGCSTPADPASPGVKKGLFGLLSRGAQRLREIRDVTWPTASDVGTLPPTDFRNARFKLVPSISEGPWVAKSAVGSTPTLLGKKVRDIYSRGSYDVMDTLFSLSLSLSHSLSHTLSLNLSLSKPLSLTHSL
jgi:hypothetical protein